MTPAPRLAAPKLAPPLRRRAALALQLAALFVPLALLARAPSFDARLVRRVTAPVVDTVAHLNAHLAEQRRAARRGLAAAPPPTPPAPSAAPPPLAAVYPLARPAKPDVVPDFTKPRILAFYAQRHNASSDVYELVVYSSGVSLGSFGRGIRIIGCLVGDHAYQATVSDFDVTRCEIPRAPAPSDRVSVLLLHDDVLRHALTFKPVVMRDKLTVKLDPGDVIDTGPLQLHFDFPRTQLVNGFGLKTVRSPYVWSSFPPEPHPLSENPARARYHLCLITQVKPFAELLPDWIRYHRMLGVDHVFISDNASPTDLPAAYALWPDVEVVYWPWHRSQVQGLSFLLHAARPRCEWVIAADVDEYLLMGLADAHPNVRPLAQYLDHMRAKHFTQILFRYTLMAGAVEKRATQPLPLAYTKLSMRQNPLNGKSACTTDLDWRVHGVHNCQPLFKDKDLNVAELGHGPREPNSIYDIPGTVHFKFRSWEELRDKFRSGSSSLVDWTHSMPSDAEEEMPDWFIEEATEEWGFCKQSYQKVLHMYSKRVNEQRLVWHHDGQRCFMVRDLKTGAAGQIKCDSRR